MSRRSHLSVKEELRRGFIDIGRYRYTIHKVDMEPWRDRCCPICGNGFSKAPRYYMMGYAIHNACSHGNAFEEWFSAFTED